jgi:hypothetical protein
VEPEQGVQLCFWGRNPKLQHFSVLKLASGPGPDKPDQCLRLVLVRCQKYPTKVGWPLDFVSKIKGHRSKCSAMRPLHPTGKAGPDSTLSPAGPCGKWSWLFPWPHLVCNKVKMSLPILGHPSIPEMRQRLLVTCHSFLPGMREGHCPRLHGQEFGAV